MLAIKTESPINLYALQLLGDIQRIMLDDEMGPMLKVRVLSEILHAPPPRF